jgi:hypothetical protein
MICFYFLVVNLEAHLLLVFERLTRPFHSVLLRGCGLYTVSGWGQVRFVHRIVGFPVQFVGI